MHTFRKLLVLIIVILIVLVLGVGSIVFLKQTPSEVVPEPILKISYCGVELEELCVLSFGRDLAGNMIINFFVPSRTFPDFYLKIKRTGVESAYQCEKNIELPTSVYCIGESVGLQEKIEIHLFSKKDDHIMAAGKLTLSAFLLATSDGNRQASATPLVTIDSNDLTATTTPFLMEVTQTVVPTSILYPDQSYP